MNALPSFYSLLSRFSKEDVEFATQSLQQLGVMVKRKRTELNFALSHATEKLLHPSSCFRRVQQEVQQSLGQDLQPFLSSSDLMSKCRGGEVASFLLLQLKGLVEALAQVPPDILDDGKRRRTEEGEGEEQRRNGGGGGGGGGISSHILQTMSEGLQAGKGEDLEQPLPECVIVLENNCDSSSSIFGPFGSTDDSIACYLTDLCGAGEEDEEDGQQEDAADLLLLPFWRRDGKKDEKENEEERRRAMLWLEKLSCWIAEEKEEGASVQQLQQRAEGEMTAVGPWPGEVVEVGGMVEKKLVAKKHSSIWMMETEDAPPAQAAGDAEQAGADMGASRRAAEALRDPQVLVPWFTVKGEENEEALEALKASVCERVWQNPGIPESHLRSRYFMLNPRTLGDVLVILEAEGKVEVRALHVPQCSLASPPLPTIFESYARASEFGGSFSAANPSVSRERYLYPKRVSFKPLL
ncbi:hypothetical protein GUITHDRAFT_117310 [Guillardia theta CCMP2712]|uniref:Uncharacterized protein n=1 Tax=Guillardia theta (strain CCMP2712) TaxID=905079 RepID=L1IL54_GUITC|nr:hypothetical protein GUITHDRAFT_117310 [Guillardia theta CCMP2712]EKX36530.1 hypothetical protein GUITHDRAFT_117310 [Guillardia theta CCMP2712]|eukprot:XP_005823510.1 hypothetical protein GUITHDRAFT_117310 [Guillardia theta CCMP2712]